MRRSAVPGGPHPCVGRTELFLRPDGEPGEARRTREAAAKEICAGCDARVECLEVAIENRRLHGARVDVDVYGGLNPEERIELLRQLPSRAS